VWRAYKQKRGQCKYLLAKKCDLDVAAGFLHRLAGVDGVFSARYQPLSGGVDVQLRGR
jgi:hypothetical protein